MLIKMTEVFLTPNTNTYSMREVLVNPEHVTAVREDYSAKRALTENRMPDGLSQTASFSTLYLASGQHGLNMTVVGTPSMLEEKLTTGKKILKG